MWLLRIHQTAAAAAAELASLSVAGRRSTDLLHLLLQNLYFMHHARSYIGERGATCLDVYVLGIHAAWGLTPCILRCFACLVQLVVWDCQAQLTFTWHLVVCPPHFLHAKLASGL
jgi:hypothetical protein